MKIKDLVKDLLKVNQESNVSIEAINDNGDFYSEGNIYVTFDSHGDALICLGARE